MRNFKRDAHRGWTAAALALTAGWLLGGGCELDSDPCRGAKDHLCSKIEQQWCDPSTMENAVAKVTSECGDTEAARFTEAAKQYCLHSEAFEAGTCASQ